MVISNPCFSLQPRESVQRSQAKLTLHQTAFSKCSTCTLCVVRSAARSTSRMRPGCPHSAVISRTPRDSLFRWILPGFSCFTSVNSNRAKFRGLRLQFLVHSRYGVWRRSRSFAHLSPVCTPAAHLPISEKYHSFCSCAARLTQPATKLEVPRCPAAHFKQFAPPGINVGNARFSAADLRRVRSKNRSLLAV